MQTIGADEETEIITLLWLMALAGAHLARYNSSQFPAI
jgi:hypothetical protein